MKCFYPGIFYFFCIIHADGFPPSSGCAPGEFFPGNLPVFFPGAVLCKEKPEILFPHKSSAGHIPEEARCRWRLHYAESVPPFCPVRAEASPPASCFLRVHSEYFPVPFSVFWEAG